MITPWRCNFWTNELAYNIGFLGVVIGLEGIKIEEEKVKGVLDWPTSKCVKDMQKFLGLANYYC